jgi:DNA-binding NtrC family response regulator
VKPVLTFNPPPKRNLHRIGHVVRTDEGPWSYVAMPSEDSAASVVLADDDLSVRIPLALILRRVGVNVLEIDNTDDVLACIDGQRVDLVIADIGTPGKLGGLDLIQKARDLNPSLPIIVTSGDDRPLDNRALGVPFIAKPYSVDWVVTLALELLRLPMKCAARLARHA